MSSTAWVPVTFGLYSASSTRDVDALGREVGVERRRVEHAVDVHRLELGRVEVLHPHLPRQLEPVEPGRVQMNVDQRAAVEHQGASVSISTWADIARSSTRRTLPVAVVG